MLGHTRKTMRASSCNENACQSTYISKENNTDIFRITLFSTTNGNVRVTSFGIFLENEVKETFQALSSKISVDNW